MSYYTADVRGYLADIASVGGWHNFIVWEERQHNALQLHNFVQKGFTEDPQSLADELRDLRSDILSVETTRIGLQAAARRAEEFLIFTDGTSNEELRTSAKKPLFGYAFRRTDPAVVEWAKEHAAELVQDITEATRNSIREAIVSALEGESKHVAVGDLIAAVGDDDRALRIAENEGRTSVLEGQRLMWDQAVEDGTLTGKEKRVWVIGDKACPDCEELDGEEASLDGEYPGDGGDGPPLHVGCDCSEDLVEVK